MKYGKSFTISYPSIVEHVTIVVMSLDHFIYFFHEDRECGIQTGYVDWKHEYGDRIKTPKTIRVQL